MIHLSVSDVMTGTVRTTTPAETMAGVATRLREEGIGSLIVVDPTSDELTGIVTESDIVRLVAAGAAGATTVSEMMSSDVITIAPDASIHDAARLMREHSIRRLPVVEGGELVGMLTTTNLVHYLPRLRNTILRERTQA